MIREAFISGTLGKAIFMEDQRCLVVNIDEPDRTVECYPIDYSTFFNFGAEFTALSNGQLNIAYISSQLVAKYEQHRALTLSISGMDPVLDYESREFAITTANRLVENDSTHHFVRSRLLIKPAPEEADLETAVDIALQSNSSLVHSFYQFMFEHERALALVYETWLKSSEEFFTSEAQQLKSQQLLTDLGVFAGMASALAADDVKGLSSIVVAYGHQLESTHNLSRAVHLLNQLRTTLTKQWKPARKDKKRRYKLATKSEQFFEDYTVREAVARFDERDKKTRLRTLTADQAKEKVDHQIAAISNLILQGKTHRANRYLQDLIDFHVEHSEPEHLAMSLCSLAKVAMDAHSFDLAEKLVDYALLLRIDDVVIFNTQAEMFRAAGNLDKAQSVYEATIERFPNNEVARGGYAEVLKATGNLDKALSVYEATIERFPNSGVARNGYAEVLKATGDFDKALSVYEATIKRFPNNVVVHTGYAEVLKATGDFDKALSVYEATIKRFPNDVVVHTGYAEVLKAIGDFDKALSVYEATIERFPNSGIARNGYAEVLKATGDFDKALSVYEATIKRFPNDVVVHTGYAEVLKAIGDFDKALSVYEATIKRFPNDVVVHTGYAEVLKAIGDFDKALSVYETTIAVFPNSEVVRGCYAELLRAMGDLEAAKAVYKEATSRFPKNEVLRNGYANVLVLSNAFDEARLLLPRTPPRSFEDWIAYHINAMSYLKEDRIDEAVGLLSYGFNNAPIIEREYFATALAIAKLRKREFADIPKLLPTNVTNIDFAQRQTRLILVGHSQAALGNTKEASETLAELEATRNPQVISLKEAISRRYALGHHSRSQLSTVEAKLLDSAIDEQEFLLAA